MGLRALTIEKEFGPRQEDLERESQGIGDIQEGGLRFARSVYRVRKWHKSAPRLCKISDTILLDEYCVGAVRLAASSDGGARGQYSENRAK